METAKDDIWGLQSVTAHAVTTWALKPKRALRDYDAVVFWLRPSSYYGVLPSLCKICLRVPMQGGGKLRHDVE